MATETLNIASIDQAANWSGVVGDIDEALSAADGAEITNTSGEGDVLLLGLDNTSLTDADTVNSVTINIRAKRGTNANDSLTVQLVIGGTAQGSAHDFSDGGGTLGTSHSNSGAISDAGWNSDWTQAQLNGMQVEVVTTQGGMPQNVDLAIDCMDVVVDYTPAPPAFDQDSYRGRDDDQTLNSATFDHALNTKWAQTTDTNFRVRWLVQETGGISGSVAFKVQFRRNEGAWTDVSGTSVCQWAATGEYADADATSQVLGAGTFVAGEGMDNDASTGSISFSGSDETEVEGCFQIDSGQVNNGDKIELRLVESDSTAFSTYTNTPHVVADNGTGTVGATWPATDTSDVEAASTTFTTDTPLEGVSNRKYLVYVVSEGSPGFDDYDATAVSVGGQSLTQVATISNSVTAGSNYNHCSIWAADESAITSMTGNLDEAAVTWKNGGSGALEAACITQTLYNATQGAAEDTDTAEDAGTPASISVTVATKAAADYVAAAAGNSAETATHSWSGATELLDAALAGASYTFGENRSGTGSVTATITPTNGTRMVAAGLLVKLFSAGGGPSMPIVMHHRTKNFGMS